MLLITGFLTRGICTTWIRLYVWRRQAGNSEMEEEEEETHGGKESMKEKKNNAEEGM